MNRSSFFIDNKALFGSFPSIESVYELQKEGVKYFIDVTCINERGIKRYNNDLLFNGVYIQYEILDNRVPSDYKSFSKFIVYISNIINSLKKKELIYIHCKGGHGRSCIVVSCILSYLFKKNPKESISIINDCHNNRIDMKYKWRKIGFPQTYIQKKFIYNFFSSYYIDNVLFDKIIKIENLYLLNVNSFLEKVINSKENSIIIRKILLIIFTECINQNSDIKDVLINTGLKRLIYKTSIIGDILTDLRDTLYLE